jgi:hypothetical protein
MTVGLEIQEATEFRAVDQVAIDSQTQTEGAVCWKGVPSVHLKTSWVVLGV